MVAQLETISTQGISAKQGKSNGTSYSVNQPSVSSLGTKLATVVNNNLRIKIGVQNQSAGNITIVRQDGTQIILASGGPQGSPGGSWESVSFQGQIDVYGANGAQIAVYED